MIMKYRNSRPFMDLLHQIPKLSRPPSVFKNFPGPEKMNRPKPSQPTGFKEFQESAQRTVGVGRLPFPWIHEYHAVPDGPARRAASCTPCCIQKWTLSVIKVKVVGESSLLIIVSLYHIWLWCWNISLKVQRTVSCKQVLYATRSNSSTQNNFSSFSSLQQSVLQ